MLSILNAWNKCQWKYKSIVWQFESIWVINEILKLFSQENYIGMKLLKEIIVYNIVYLYIIRLYI